MKRTNRVSLLQIALDVGAKMVNERGLSNVVAAVYQRGVGRNWKKTSVDMFVIGSRYNPKEVHLFADTTLLGMMSTRVYRQEISVPIFVVFGTMAGELREISAAMEDAYLQSLKLVGEQKESPDG